VCVIYLYISRLLLNSTKVSKMADVKECEREAVVDSPQDTKEESSVAAAAAVAAVAESVADAGADKAPVSKPKPKAKRAPKKKRTQSNGLGGSAKRYVCNIYQYFGLILCCVLYLYLYLYLPVTVAFSFHSFQLPRPNPPFDPHLRPCTYSASKRN
jgi:hypothetical protein